MPKNPVGRAVRRIASRVLSPEILRAKAIAYAINGRTMFFMKTLTPTFAFSGKGCAERTRPVTKHDDDPALHGRTAGSLRASRQELSRFLWRRHGDELATLEAQNQHFKTGGKGVCFRVGLCANRPHGDGGLRFRLLRSRREPLAIMLGDLLARQSRAN